MKLLNQYTRKLTSKMTSEWMPFADVATAEYAAVHALLRLSMFQLSIGLATRFASWHAEPSDDC
jgi:hypothetical protein